MLSPGMQGQLRLLAVRLHKVMEAGAGPASLERQEQLRRAHRCRMILGAETKSSSSSLPASSRALVVLASPVLCSPITTAMPSCTARSATLAHSFTCKERT